MFIYLDAQLICTLQRAVSNTQPQQVAVTTSNSEHMIFAGSSNHQCCTA